MTGADNKKMPPLVLNECDCPPDREYAALDRVETDLREALWEARRAPVGTDRYRLVWGSFWPGT